MKKIIAFDLDGTLAESKQSLDSEMVILLSKLLSIKKVAIVTGGEIQQIKKQVIRYLEHKNGLLKNLYLFPTKGSAMYVFKDEDWKEVYNKKLSGKDKDKIRKAFKIVFDQVDFITKNPYGEILEDRDSQFTFSALGQDASPVLKKDWDKDAKKRQRIRNILLPLLPEFEIEIGGSTSIDITQKNIDKAFALEELCKYANTLIEEVLFIGDGLFVGGNDYAVVKTGVDTIQVKDHNETKKIVQKIINSSSIK